jgi:hypothetical protein
MPGTPVLGVSIDFANGPAFGNPLILDDPTTPLGTGILADAPGDVVDVSNIDLESETLLTVTLATRVDTTVS